METAGDWYSRQRDAAKVLASELETLRLRLGVSATMQVSPRHPNPDMAGLGLLQKRLDSALYVAD